MVRIIRIVFALTGFFAITGGDRAPENRDAGDQRSGRKPRRDLSIR